MEQAPGSGLSGFARKARLVTRPPAQSDAHVHVGIDHKKHARRRSIGGILAALFSVVIAAFSIYILGRTVSAVNLSDLRQAIAATSAQQIAGASFFTVLSFLALTGYDGLALRQLRARVPYKTTALASFTSYAISFTLGFPLITGGTVRYWIYSQAGLAASKVASLTIIAGVTFWFGMIFVIGAGLAFHATAISEINHIFPFLNMLMGYCVLGTILAYLVWVTIRKRHVRIRGLSVGIAGPWFVAGPDHAWRHRSMRGRGCPLCLAADSARSSTSSRLRQPMSLPAFLEWRAMRRAASAFSRQRCSKPCRSIRKERCSRPCCSSGSFIILCLFFSLSRSSAPMKASAVGTVCARSCAGPRKKTLCKTSLIICHGAGLWIGTWKSGGSDGDLLSSSADVLTRRGSRGNLEHERLFRTNPFI